MSWLLRPPYLYLLNSIIITIVASAKLQSSSKVIVIDGLDNYHHPSSNLETLVDPIDTEAYSGGRVSKTGHDDEESIDLTTTTQPPLAVYGRGGGYANLHLGNTYDSLLLSSAATSYYNTNKGSKEEEVQSSAYSITAGDHTNLKLHHLSTAASAAKEATNFDFISITKNHTDPAHFFRPPVSARFSTHRKLIKTPTPIHGGKTMRVAKPKRNETLESTWKTITDGRPMPLTRHLRKSDTWETHGGRHHDHEDMRYNKMNKYGTFNDRSSIKSSGSGKLRKDPTSQDDLNKRVEAFINKFNEDMRLQRQESHNQYIKMINRGAH